MCSDAAGLARSRTRTYEKDGKRKRAFSTKGAMPYELFCGRQGQPLVIVFFRKELEEKQMHGNATGEKGASYMKRLCKKREKNETGFFR